MCKRSLFFSIVLAVLYLAGCSSKSPYETMVQEGLESEVQADSLFLGYYFGMPRKEFREHSWELNQKGLMSGFSKIEYPFHELKSEAVMRFYPDFMNDKIVRIPVSVGYIAWAPWNKEFWPENLIQDMIGFYKKEYDTTFQKVYLPDLETEVFVSIEGNREIRIYKETESTVMVDFRDLTALNPFKK